MKNVGSTTLHDVSGVTLTSCNTTFGLQVLVFTSINTKLLKIWWKLISCKSPSTHHKNTIEFCFSECAKKFMYVSLLSKNLMVQTTSNSHLISRKYEFLKKNPQKMFIFPHITSHHVVKWHNLTWHVRLWAPKCLKSPFFSFKRISCLVNKPLLDYQSNEKGNGWKNYNSNYEWKVT